MYGNQAIRVNEYKQAQNKKMNLAIMWVYRSFIRNRIFDIPSLFENVHALENWYFQLL